jgi:hypothetical protein
MLGFAASVKAWARSGLSAYFTGPTMDSTESHLEQIFHASHITLPSGLISHLSGVLQQSTVPVKEAVNRIMVTGVTQSKATTESEHEFLINDLVDSKRVLPDRKILLERTVSELATNIINGEEVPDEPLIRKFLQHPSSKDILAAIRSNIPSASVTPESVALASASTLAPASAALSSLSSSLPRLPRKASSTPILPLTNPSPSQETPLFDKATLKVVSMVHDKKQGNAPQVEGIPAEDRFLGENYLRNRAYGTGHNAWHYKPHGLNIVHLAVLALVVHRERPLYSLMKDQCYWFATIIYEVIKLLFPNPNGESNNLRKEDKFKKETAEVFIPFDYMPQGKVTGRWQGIKVSQAEDLVLATICVKFWEEYEKTIKSVILPYSL